MRRNSNVLNTSRAIIFNKIKKNKFDVRPIAIVTILVRLSSAVIVKLEIETILANISKYQYRGFLPITTFAITTFSSQKIY